MTSPTPDLPIPTEGQYLPPREAFFDWGRLTESTERIATDTFNTLFAKYQLVKPGGVQAATAGAQVFKFDPSLIKYDEKGLTIAGVPLFEKYSLQGALGDHVKNLKNKIDPPEPKKPSVSVDEVTAIKSKLTAHSEAIKTLLQDRAHNASTKRASVESRANRTDSRRLGGSIPPSRANAARAADLRRQAAQLREVEEASRRLMTTIGH
ncbi:hypothetical protein ACFWAT_22290 [Streptomyces syringium]|uniref:hypothetical protein n=1 Tax=Streptomyces syringium TaxID=76729 RepID=UPI00364F5993